MLFFFFDDVFPTPFLDVDTTWETAGKESFAHDTW